MYLIASYSNQDLQKQAPFGLVSRLFLCTFILLLTTASLSAQTWERFFDFTSHDFSKNILQTADGGILVLSHVGNGTSISNPFLLKLNADGDSIWTKTYGGSSYDEVEEVIQTSDGGYLIVGYTFSFGVGGDVYVIKTAEDGTLEWQTTFGGTGFDRARSVVETSDGNFAFAGWTRSPISGDVSQPPLGAVDLFDCWLGKFTPTGVLIWERRIGGAENDEIQRATASAGGGVAFVANTSSPEVGATGFDILGVELDTDGIEVWSQIYGGTDYEEVFSMINTSDGGYAIGGLTNSFGAGESGIYLVKTDANGVEEWAETYGGTAGEFGGYILEHPDGGYALAAATQSFGSTELDVHLVRADALGVEQWAQTYEGGLTNSLGGNNIDIATGIALSDDGYFLIAGQRRVDDAMNNILSSDLYILKTDALGNTVSNTIEGEVLWDNNNDCIADVGTNSLEDWLIIANGTKTYYGTTDVNGYYNIEVEVGTYAVELVRPNDYWTPCVPSSTIVFTAPYDTLTADFVVSSTIDCAYLETDVSTPYLNRCEENTYTVRYCNRGTIDEDDAFVSLDLHPDFTLLDASLVLFSQNGNQYVFQVGAIANGYCDDFEIVVDLDCSANIQGQTHEIIAQITPDEICSPINPAWDGSSIEVSANCVADSVQLTIKNKGANDMSADAYFIVIIDDLISRTDTYDLPANGELTFVEYPEGQTLRVETPQSPGHPGRSHPSVFVEACGVNNTGGISLGYVNQFAEDDANAFISIDAQESYENFLPNPLRAYPDGYGSLNSISPNTDIEYHLRFQHIGGDTLQEVVIEDQLPEELDIRTVRPGASSHPYDFEILGEGILRFTFDTIQLPGDLINEAASHGFVKFRVSQKANLWNGASFGNRVNTRLADTLIKSNTTWHTIAHPNTYGASSIELCENEPYNGQFYVADTIVLDTFFFESYDSIVSTAITVLNIASTLVDTTLMDGENYHGVIYETDTVLLETWPAMNGCDSLVTVNIAVEINGFEVGPDGLLDISCFPNPSVGNFELKYRLPNASTIGLAIYGLEGQKIQTLVEEDHQEAGSHHMTIPHAALAPGTYLLYMDTEWGRLIKKLVKL